MNNGAFGEGFPYTNFHELNMDWIVKIAKDFLDQYTHIQDTIAEGLTDLTNKANELEQLLQTWYDTHSEDIANQLANALEDLNQWYSEHLQYLDRYVDNSVAEFETQARAKANEVIQTIPADYTELANNVSTNSVLINELATQGLAEVPLTWTDGGYIDNQTGEIVQYAGWKYTDYIDLSELTNSFFALRHSGADGDLYNAYYDANHVKIGTFVNMGINNNISYHMIFETAKYFRLSIRSTAEIKFFNINRKAPINFYRTLANNEIASSDFIPVNVPKYIISQNMPTSIIQYDSNRTLIYQFPYSADTREYYRGNAAEYVKIQFAMSNFTINNAQSVNFTEKPYYKTPQYLRLCTFNVGLWHDGVTPQPDATADAYAKSFRRFIGRNNPDVMSAQEAPEYINEGQTVESNGMILFKMPYFNRLTNQMKCYGKNSLTDPEVLQFQSGSGRPFTRYKFDMGDVELTIYNIHLSLEANSSGIRQQDLQELKNLLTDAKYTIITGDFNSYNISEVQNAFVGYNIANGGIFGTFDTWPHVSAAWPNAAIDNVITTRDISIQNVYVDDADLSDHRGLIVDLSIYY